MKMLGSIIRWFKAKDAAVAEKIEKEHELEFARQDLEGMQQDFAQVTNHVGEAKATIVGLKRDLAEKRRMISNLEEDGRALLERGKEELAAKICADIETLENEAKVFDESIAQQESMLQALEERRKQLKEAVYQAESSMRMMETMDSVARASEKISTVKTGDTSSALDRFRQRQSRVQNRLDKAKALAEMGSQERGETLKEEVDDALGRNKGARVLERLKQKK